MAQGEGDVLREVSPRNKYVIVYALEDVHNHVKAHETCRNGETPTRALERFMKEYGNKGCPARQHLRYLA